MHFEVQQLTIISYLIICKSYAVFVLGKIGDLLVLLKKKNSLHLAKKCQCMIVLLMNSLR